MGLDFVSELAQFFKTQTYVADDFIFVEKDKAESVFYIVSGKVAMVHKQTHTFLVDLQKENYFGEVGLLTGDPRSLSAKSRDFTEVFILKKRDFNLVSENYIDAIKILRKIKDDYKKDDFTSLQTRCYICNSPKHLALKCGNFSKWRGNLMRIYIILTQLKEGKKVQMQKQKGKNLHKKLLENNTFENEFDKNELKRLQYMAYVEEDHENRHYPSMESDRDADLKQKLIWKHFPEHEQLLDGELISDILEQPSKVKE